MTLASVTIWYNPDESFARNILTYSGRMGTCYIVDNSCADNGALAAGIPNAVYIPNRRNLGIAAALNTGCARAMADGCEWCMTMDQDSSWDGEQLGRYLELVSARIAADPAGKVVSFAPAIESHPAQSVLGKVRDRILPRKKARAQAEEAVPESREIEGCITSGNVVSLSAWSAVGKFYEPFFIDEVDHEFCYRLREHGLTITEFPRVIMHHRMGDPKVTFYPAGGNYTGRRLYYMVRNALYMRHLHPDLYERKGYKNVTWWHIKAELLNFRPAQLVWILRGVHDGKRGILGSYEDRKRHE